jgi:hypothetical protein
MTLGKKSAQDFHFVYLLKTIKAVDELDNAKFRAQKSTSGTVNINNVFNCTCHFFHRAGFDFCFQVALHGTRTLGYIARRY